VTATSKSTPKPASAASAAPAAPRPLDSIAHSELVSADPAATRAFLEAVFHWRFEARPGPGGDYLAFQTGGGSRGGVRAPGPKEAPGTLSYVLVADLDDAMAAIRRAGGEIVLPRTDAPMGSFCWFKVPGGPILAAWQDAPGRT
jgi:predicted enzyme related to lactoylglutathione lyase